MATQVITYRLRGGQIQPINSTCGGSSTIEGFFMQTFGAERIVTDIDDAKVELLASTDMQGQKPGDVEDITYIATTYSKASYQGRPLRTTDGDLVFSATEQHVPQFVEEEDVGVV